MGHAGSRRRKLSQAGPIWEDSSEEASLDPGLKGLTVLPVCQVFFQELCTYSLIYSFQSSSEAEAVIILISQMGKLRLGEVSLPKGTQVVPGKACRDPGKAPEERERLGDVGFGGASRRPGGSGAASPGM